MLRALGRCMVARRSHALSRAVAAWRLSLSHILRHQALLRLQSQSQAQQQSLAALRRSLPASSVPRAGRPSGGDSATQHGGALLRLPLLLLTRLGRVSLCRSDVVGIEIA